MRPQVAETLNAHLPHSPAGGAFNDMLLILMGQMCDVAKGPKSWNESVVQIVKLCS